MRKWALLLAVVILGSVSGALAGADDTPMFDPPPLPDLVSFKVVAAGLQEETSDPADQPSEEAAPEQTPAEPARLPEHPGYAVTTGDPPNPLPGTTDFSLGDGTASRSCKVRKGTCRDCGCCRCNPSCRACCRTKCSGSIFPCCSDELSRLFDSPKLDCYGIEIGGWIDQGASVVANMPDDRFNGVVTFNDRDGEYQMNQFWLYIERSVDGACCGLDVGGRIDFLYGTDARFTQAADGLEAQWNQRERFYQVALPQFYLDIGLNDWTVRMGHFYTILGYEVVQAPDNFFYSHAYTMQYGEPFTHTGLLVMRDLDQFSIVAGLHRGNDRFDDNDDGLDSLDFLGGISWTNYARDLSAAFAITAAEEGPDVNQMIYSFVGTWNLSPDVTYVIQHDYGQQYDDRQSIFTEWYGINQYVLYDLDDCWSLGVRLEWFRDNNGTRVTGLGQGNRNVGPFAGDFYAVTAGLNWKPHPNVIVRPELRWDWFDSALPGGNLPFDAGDDDSQFMAAVDAIVTF